MDPDANTCKDKRTNSLAFARSDCHTCSASDERCDRRRPRCSTCLNQGRKCGGFATTLSWDSKRMWSDNPSTVNDNATGLSSGNTTMNVAPRAALIAPDRPAPPRRFRFIEGPSKPRKQRKACLRGYKRRRSVVQEDESAIGEECISGPGEWNRGMAVGDQMEDHSGVQESQSSDLFDDLSFFGSLMPNIFESANAFDFGPQDSLMTDMSALISLPKTSPLPSTEKVIGSRPEQLQSNTPVNGFDPILPEPIPRDETWRVMNLDTSHILTPATSPRLQTDIAELGLSPQDHDSLLEMYDYEFCVLPLTSDISINPFRCQRQTSQGSRLLFHSILALCCQHLRRFTGSWATEADEHRRKALQLLEDALQHEKAHCKLHLLEPILILFTLDCTLSAAGKWTTHLNRAYSMLQVCGGPSSLSTPRVRSQVGMLLWWDATLALISRHGLIIDRSYLQFLTKWEKQDKWSFFDLTGCPGDLLVHLFHLAELAGQSEVARSMEWLSFNIAPVMVVEKKLVEWINEISSPDDDDLDLPDSEIEKQLHEQQDRYYCAEAWRYTLLLYIDSVFKSDRQTRSLAINQRVRKIIDSIRCCRRTSQTQKQLLLPVFLAGCETSDEDMRNFVKDYCSYWGEKSRYGMFTSASELLGEIWATGKWWGYFIDSKTKGPSHGQGRTQLLFG